MTEKALEIVYKIGDWYLMEQGTYTRIYRATKSLHILPKFIPDNLVLQAKLDTLLSFRFGGERFRRHDPKEVVKEY
jgi:hypothetical protein